MTSASVGLAGVPYVHLGVLHVGIPIQAFGVIVAVGVLVGVHLLRSYGLRRGADHDDLRVLTVWVIASGFVGAHVFDVLAYQPAELMRRPLVLLELWSGLSSFGGFLGGAVGFTLCIRSRRLPIRAMADIVMVGLLPAFTLVDELGTGPLTEAGSIVDIVRARLNR